MSAVLPKSGSEPLLASCLTEEIAAAIRESSIAGLKRLPKHGLEVGGILTSRSLSAASLRADGMAPIASEYRFGPSLRLSAADLIQLLDQSEQVRASGSRILGFWRSAVDGALAYTTDDLDILRDIFPESQLLLIVKPSVESQTVARAFQPNEAGVWMPVGDFELTDLAISAPIRPSISRPSAPIERARVPPSQIQPKGLDSAATAKASVSKDRGKIRNLAILVALFLMSAGISATWFLIESRRPPAPPRSAAKDLGMQIEHVGSSLRLSWNTQSEIVQSARGGLLLVDDGLQHRQFLLDAGQVSNGYILYTPASGDVTFRLEIPDPNRKLVVETVRVLDGSRDLSAGLADPALQAPVRPSAPPLAAPGTLADPKTGKQIVARSPEPSKTPAQSVPAEPQKPVFRAQAVPVASRKVESRPIGEAAPPVIASTESASAIPLPGLKDSFDAGPPPKEVTPQAELPKPQVTASVPSSVTNTAPSAVSVAPRHVADANSSKTLAAVPKFEAPKPTKQVMPNRNQFGPSVIYGPTEVQVLVGVDASGNVKDAHIINNKQLGRNMLLSTQAIAAAREWKFEPAKMNGKRTESSFTIVFQFAPKP